MQETFSFAITYVNQFEVQDTVGREHYQIQCLM